MRNLSKDARTFGQTLGLALGFIFSLCLFSLAQAEPVDLQAQMSPDQYRAAGLDQLSDAQRAVLQAWLTEHLVQSPDSEPKLPALVQQDEIPLVPVQVPVQAPVNAATPKGPESADRAKFANLDRFGDEQVKKKKPPLPEVVEAQIAGDFRGWDGKTVFRLTNGQVWQQRVGGRYRYRAVDPAVRIQRARFGYYLELVATGRKVGIKRVK